MDIAHKIFSNLMSKTELILNDDAKSNPDIYKRMTAFELENYSVEKIKLACSDTPFNPNEVKLVSGHKFPDIVAEKYYGIEVKSTISDSWTSTGSSIMETTRIDNVDDIYMLFGKLGGNNPEFRCRPYQDVLYDIAVTHSPRYLINMELEKGKSIFSKMGTTYDVFRKSEDSINQVRKYYRNQAIQQNKQEMPWWITSENIGNAHSFNIKLWNSLDLNEKRELQAKSMVLFPEILDPSNKKDKYNNITLWLCSYNQVINPNIRDLYSAGGKITHVNGKKLDCSVAQIFNMIVEYSDIIKKILNEPSYDFKMMIKEFNPIILEGKDMFEQWLNMCCEIAEKYNVPLIDWIKNKPVFSFSK